MEIQESFLITKSARKRVANLEVLCLAIAGGPGRFMGRPYIGASSRLIPLIPFSAELQRIGETIETIAYD